MRQRKATRKLEGAKRGHKERRDALKGGGVA